jgi:CubicO group peptidase (beta-lactamase class C family)
MLEYLYKPRFGRTGSQGQGEALARKFANQGFELRRRNHFIAVAVVAFIAVVASARPVAQTANTQSVKTSEPERAQVSETPAQTEQRIHRIEANIATIPLGEGQAPLQLDLQSLMQQFHMPGLSIAVIDHFRIVWAKGYVVTAAGSNTPVSTETLFQTGSISKAVAAMGTMHLVEQGKWSLDEDVNQKLVSWKVPENQFTQDQKVTLRRIMSHSAGTTVHGFDGYATDAPIPSLVQILNGQKPANNVPIVVDIVPGAKWRYSGGGVLIEQQLVIDVTGKPFPEFMRETVLEKIGMDHSTYEQPLPAAKAAMAASGTYQNGTMVPGKWHVYPEIAAAGLWTTPTDLAKCAIEMALSKVGKSNRVLSEKTTREMLTPQIDHVGLGFFLDENNPDQFGHDGDNDGFEAVLVMLADSGQGVAIMANSQNLYHMQNCLIESVAREYSWKYIPPKHAGGDLLMIATGVKGPEAAIRAYNYARKTHASEYVFSEADYNMFGYELLNSNKIDQALEVFKTNVEQYPNSWNVYDSLGEAFMKAGQINLAIQNYEKSLELNPKNDNGAAMLKKLKGQN